VKTLRILFLIPWLWLAPSAAHAAVFTIAGELEGDENAPYLPGQEDIDEEQRVRFVGDTRDYLRLRVRSDSLLRFSTMPSGYRFELSDFLGREDYFGGRIGLLEPNCAPFFCINTPETPPRIIDWRVSAGEYILATSVAHTFRVGGRINELGPDSGYRIANSQGGGFFRGSYSFTVEGDIELVDFWHGHIDRTWTKTYFGVPEPSGAALVLATSLSLLRRRRVAAPP
jgi:hypothetical protein